MKSQSMKGKPGGWRPAGQMPAGEFKARCLKVLDQVAETRQPVVVTKRGHPVAQLVPIAEPTREIVGAMRGTVLWEGDLIAPVDVAWEAAE